MNTDEQAYLFSGNMGFSPAGKTERRTSNALRIGYSRCSRGRTRTSRGPQYGPCSRVSPLTEDRQEQPCSGAPFRDGEGSSGDAAPPRQPKKGKKGDHVQHFLQTTYIIKASAESARIGHGRSVQYRFFTRLGREAKEGTKRKSTESTKSLQEATSS